MKKFISKNKYIIYTLIISSAIYIFQLFICRIFPFGNNAIIVGDIGTQYIPFLSYLKSVVNGQDSILYSFSKGMGGETLGLWAYYLMSPINLISLLFRKENLAEAVILIIGIKFVISSITMYIYLNKKIENKLFAILLSLCYAFCGYNVAFQVNFMWMDGVYLLPLIIMGIEYIVDENRYNLYIITTALSLIFNFYIGYMTTIFGCIYFAYYVLVNKGNIKEIFKLILRFALYTIIAIGIACFIILPLFGILSNGKGESLGRGVFHKLVQINKMGYDLFAKMLVNTTNNMQLFDGLPNIYSGLISIILLELYFINDKITKRKKLLSAIIIGIVVFSFMNKAINIFWHGTKEPIGYLYRYSFMLSFLIISFASEIVDSISEKSTLKRIIVLEIINVFIIGISFIINIDFLSKTSIIINIGLITGYSILIYLYSRYKEPKNIIIGLMILLLSAETIINMTYTYQNIEHMKLDEYKNEWISKYKEIMDDAKPRETEFYRIENDSKMGLNDSMMYGYNGISQSTSTYNKKHLEFMKNIGYDWHMFFSDYGYGNTIITDSLFGIKKKVSKKEDKYFNTIKKYNEEYLLENKYPLEIGYAINAKETDTINKEKSPFENQEVLLNDLANDNLKYFNDVKESEIRLNKISQENNLYNLEQIDESYIEIEYDVSNVKEQLYFWIDTDYDFDEPAFKLFINDEFYDYYVGSRKFGIIKVDAKKDKLNIKLKANIQGNINIEDFQLKEINIKNFEKAYSNISNIQIKNVEYKSNNLKFIVNNTSDKDGIFLSVPYDDNWNIKVNNNRVKAKNIDGFIGIEINKNANNSVSMTYIPKEIRLGAVVSLISILLLIFLNYKYKKE